MGSYEKTFSKNSQKIIGVRLWQNGSPVPPCERQPWQGQYSNWPEEAVIFRAKNKTFPWGQAAMEKRQPGSANEYGRWAECTNNWCHIFNAFCKFQHKTHKIGLSHETYQDIASWQSVLENFNGKSLLLHQKNLITVCA